MTCEEFELAGLDLEELQQDDPAHRAAREHMRSCPRCAALHENWQTLRADLHAVGADTQDAEAPSRVEMRLRQEFRTRHKTVKAQRAAAYAGWALAAAAVVLAAVSWVNWRHENRKVSAPSGVNSAQGVNLNKTTPAGPELGETIVAANDAGDFTLLPGSLPGMLEDATVVRVQMQRGALSALGLTVNEERAADLIQVDLLVGDDGQPKALRLPQTTE
jgi:anti-sigma factor RsiW